MEYIRLKGQIQKHLHRDQGLFFFEPLLFLGHLPWFNWQRLKTHAYTILKTNKNRHNKQEQRLGKPLEPHTYLRTGTSGTMWNFTRPIMPSWPTDTRRA